MARTIKGTDKRQIRTQRKAQADYRKTRRAARSVALSAVTTATAGR